MIINIMKQVWEVSSSSWQNQQRSTFENILGIQIYIQDSRFKTYRLILLKNYFTKTKKHRGLELQGNDIS